MSKLAALFPTILLAALGCGGEPDPVVPPVPGRLVQSSLQRDRQPVVESADLAEAVAGGNAFAFELYERVRARPGNVFVAPHSVTLGLAMAWAGARGDTAAEMADTLGFTLPPARQHAALNALDLALASRGVNADGEGTGPFRLKVIDSIWAQIGYSFHAPFLDTLAVNYGAGVHVLDFYGASELARVAINRWVEYMTEGHVADLLPPRSVTPEARLLLTSAVWFSAGWATPFDPGETADEPFTKLDGSTVIVPTMQGSPAKSSFALLPGLQALELPFAGEQLAMLLLLPDPGQLEAVEAELAARTAEAVAALAAQPTWVQLPRFGAVHAVDLGGVLPDMGMPLAFGAEADFTGMDAGLGRLRLAGVWHKTWVQVDEEGVEAGAGGGPGDNDGGEAPPPASRGEMRIDRPFLYLVRDLPTGAVLFIGRVLEP